MQSDLKVSTRLKFSRRHTRIEPHDLLDIFETLDRASVDAKDHIARLEAALFREWAASARVVTAAQ
jgi:hypothetical protein